MGETCIFLSGKSFVPFESQGIIPLINFESKTDLVVFFKRMKVCGTLIHLHNNIFKWTSRNAIFRFEMPVSNNRK